MSRYQPVRPSSPTSPTSPTTPRSLSRRTSLASLRRSSISSFRRPSGRAVLPDPDEMDAAFDGPDDDDAVETNGLLGGRGGNGTRVPGDYDFERDYTQPPPSPPPFQPYSAQNPAPGNSNGEIPTTPPQRPPTGQPRHFLGGILPSSILPRQSSPLPTGRVVGGGNSGVFTNLAARPNPGGNPGEERREGPEWVPEDEQKEGPPSYQAALRDAVPPYWETTVVLPSSSSPFGPLSSSISGDEILIDGMPVGNFFGFFWNLIVSASFQFVGFLLTYVLHTTHAAKYGSRVGLGITLIQFGFTLRNRAEELINSGEFPTDSSDPLPPGMTADEVAAQNEINAYFGNASPWPATISDPLLPDDAPPVTLHSLHEAKLYADAHNKTLLELLRMPSAKDVGRANEWFSFLIMSLGWFLVLTSLGGYWRVKRFEAGLKRAQRDSEIAQAEGAAARDGEPENITTRREEPGPASLEYYTLAFRHAFAGARDIQRGFFGMRGRPIGHTPLGQDGEGDEHELLDAQGFGLTPMARGPDRGDRGASPDESPRRTRGLWGV